MDDVQKTIFRKLEHAQQQYINTQNQLELNRLQGGIIAEHLDELADEIQEYTVFLNNYESDEGHT